MPKKTIETEINEFLEYFDFKKLIQFFKDVIPLFELYDVDDESDWVKDAVGKDNERTVRLIRTVYLMSKISDFHAGEMCNINLHFKKLWLRMEKNDVGQQVK